MSTKLGQNEYEHKISKYQIMVLIMGQVIPDQLVFSVLEIEKSNFSSLFGIYLHYCINLRFWSVISMF